MVEFKGLFINDEMVKGVIKYKNDNIYDGDIYNSKPHGIGKYVY